MRETHVAMPRQSLLEYFQPDSRPANEIACAWRQGYRTVRWSYGNLYRTALQFSRELASRGVAKGDRVLLWGENSGEWIAAFLGCMLHGAIAVPMDAIAEKGFARRVAEQAGVRLAVVGRGLPVEEIPCPAICLEDLQDVARPWAAEVLAGPQNALPAFERNDPVEIVFTSGTTAEPRGVVLTHGNLLANLEPIEKEIARYRRYERIFHPLRFLDLLPLSHVFGQLLGIFLPQILGATSVFLDTLNPSEVMRTIREERVSVLVTVPRLIESLRDQVERDLATKGKLEKFKRDYKAGEDEHFLRRWWRFRAIRRMFGWKFWAIVSGGAALPGDAEQFWSRLGYAVVQGYGMTETTSLVSVNHPFKLGRGSIGKALPRLALKLSEEGEILVRGENVASGYWKDAGVVPVLDADGWLHTGDLGEQDAQGTLYFKGRRKNVIVTPEGLNIYPEDLETELRKEAGVRDCVVVGLDRDGNAEPCAVLLLRDSTSDAEAIVQQANARLAPFQQMRHWTVWPDSDFPRTPTQKPMLGRIRETVERELGSRRKAVAGAGASGTAGTIGGGLGDILQRVSRGGPAPANDAAKLNLSSIERVELLSALEDRYQVDLSETQFTAADSVAALERLIEQPEARAVAYHYPRWAQAWPVRWIRTAVFYLVQRPAMFILGWPHVRGRENLRGINGPLLVVANHVTYVDPAYILAALPGRLRRHLAVAMEGEVLETMRKPPEGAGTFSKLFLRLQYALAVGLFNVFPLPQRSGFRKSFAFAGELADRGWSVLVFPEGIRTNTGNMAPFRAGIGLLATRLRLPVVPIRLDGLFERKQAGGKWAPPGRIRIAIGAPVKFDESRSAEEIAQELQRRVESLGENHA
jgi:long-chain acyl-CoA synthetase